MFSKIPPIILAVNFIFWGKGDGINVTPSEFEQVKHCYQAGRLAAKAYMEALGKLPDTDAQKIAMVCVSITEIGSCLVDLIERKLPPVPKTFMVFAALEYQHDVLLKKAGLCPNIVYDKLKEIALESGIMQEEKLSNDEDDVYKQCVGDAVRKCLLDAVNDVKPQDGKFGEDLKWIVCLGDQAKRCSASAMQHFEKLAEVFNKYVKELRKIEKK